MFSTLVFTAAIIIFTPVNRDAQIQEFMVSAPCAMTWDDAAYFIDHPADTADFCKGVREAYRIKNEQIGYEAERQQRMTEYLYNSNKKK